MKNLANIMADVEIIHNMEEIDVYLNTPVSLITSDSREVVDGCIFVAIVGNNASGVDFISQSIDNGAKIIVCDDNITSVDKSNYPKDVLFIQVANPRLAFAKMLSNWYKNTLPQNLFTITGTNGKSSTAMLISQLLHAMGKRNITIGTLGIYIDSVKQSDCLTTPGAQLLNQVLNKAWLEGINYGVMESSSHGIAQDRIAELDFIAIGFTNLTQDHLDYHKNMHEYYLAKKKLFFMNPKSTAVINVDDHYGKELAKQCQDNNIKVVEYGKNAKDFKILNIIKNPTSQIVKIRAYNVEYEFKINLMGEFQAYNTLCAIAMLSCDNFDIHKLCDCCESLIEIDGRLNLIVSPINGAKIFVDFAHTPNALEEVLKGLKKENAKSLKLLFGCGGDRDSTKRSIMGAIATMYADKIYVTDDNPRFENPSIIRSQIIEGVKSQHFTNFEEIDNREHAIAKAIAELQNNEILLIAGKGHETYQIIGSVNNYFNDKEMVLKYLGEK